MNENILLWINQSWQTPFLDVFFSWLSAKYTFSFPLIITLIIVFRLRWGKTGWYLGILMILVAATGDLFGNFLKAVFAEPRPCLEYWSMIRMPRAESTQCLTSESGMPSNHALNFFSTFTFLAYIIRKHIFTTVSLILCILVAISRIYLGEHFPAQVIAGAAIGILYGLIIAAISYKLIPGFSAINK